MFYLCVVDVHLCPSVGVGRHTAALSYIAVGCFDWLIVGSVYYGKLFEITKKQNEYFEDIINNIKKSDRYKEEKYIKDKIWKFGK